LLLQQPQQWTQPQPLQLLTLLLLLRALLRLPRRLLTLLRALLRPLLKRQPSNISIGFGRLIEKPAPGRFFLWGDTSRESAVQPAMFVV
jgi:hypothetical protein